MSVGPGGPTLATPLLPYRVAVDPPAAGQEWVVPVPARGAWIVEGIRVRFTSSAVAGDRRLSIIVSDGERDVLAVDSGADQPASDTADYYFWPGAEAGISGVGATALSAIPLGAVLPYPAAAAPDTNWLLCDGAAVSRTTYADLFALIGVTYGAGDGATTFNVPDLRGRVAVGLGTHANVNALGDNDGVAVGTRQPKHWHRDRHLLDGSQAGGGANAGGPGVSGTLGDGTGPQDGPAFLTVNYIIRAVA